MATFYSGHIPSRFHDRDLILIRLSIDGLKEISFVVFIQRAIVKPLSEHIGCNMPICLHIVPWLVGLIQQCMVGTQWNYARLMTFACDSVIVAESAHLNVGLCFSDSSSDAITSSGKHRFEQFVIRHEIERGVWSAPYHVQIFLPVSAR
jgi:hypothetical protein